MALAKQLVEFPFEMGLDTKTDSKRLDIGSLSVAENIVYETAKSLKKRSGYDLLSLMQYGETTPLESLDKIAKFKDELISFSNSTLFSYSESFEKWLERGSVYNILPKSQSIVKRFTEQTQASYVQVENFRVFAYLDSDLGVAYSVLDSSTNTFIISYEVVSATGANPKISRIDNEIYIFYTSTTNLHYKRFNILQPDTLGSEETAASDYDATTEMYDVSDGINKVVIAYNSTDVGSELKVLSVDTSDTLSSILNITGNEATNAIELKKDSLGRQILAWASATEVKVAILPNSLTATLLAATLVETISDVVNVTVTDLDNLYYIYYEVEAASVTNHYVKAANFTLTGTVTNTRELKRSVGLAAEAFTLQNRVYAVCLHNSNYQSTYFIIDNNGKISAQIAAGNAGNLQQLGGLPRTETLSSTSVGLVTQSKGALITEEAALYSLLGVNFTELTFEETDIFQNAEYSKNLHIAGGVLQMYDGINVVEHGFLLYPEALTASTTGTSGGFMSDGSYSYVAVYAWTDNQGNLHRSAASLALDVTLSGGGSTQFQTVVVPTLRLTDKENVIIELYRTENNGTTFYKATSTTTPIDNDPTVDTVSIVDVVSDADLIDGELLYTTGGVLENIVAPSARLVTNFKNRLFLAGLEKENTLQYSKETAEDVPVEFNDEFTITCSPVGGRIQAIMEMDEKLIIFKKSAIFYISGDGPNNQGEQDNFTEPELVTSDIGCIDSNSPVLTPFGIVFKSRKGVYLLDKSLGLQYVGDKIEAFNDLTITSSNVVSDLNQVRFLTDSTIALVYNYEFHKWSVFTNHGGTSSVVIDNNYYYLRTDGSVFKENRTKFSDNGTWIKLRIETGWLGFSGVQNFQRVYKAFLLGSHKSPHDLKISVAYDYVESYVHDKLVDTSSFVNYTTYGSETPYGTDETNYGGTDIKGNRYQIRVDMKKQKCQSIKFKFEDSQNTSIGEGLSISSISFQVGVKQGPYKMEINRQNGTSNS